MNLYIKLIPYWVNQGQTPFVLLQVMTLTYYHKLQEEEWMKEELKKEKKENLITLSKIIALHAQNLELSWKEETALRAEEGSQRKLYKHK